MSYITISVLIFTVTCLGFGAFLGLIRGRNRSVLRFMLVLASAFVAFFEHITKGYSDETGNWWSYTCGCIAPPNFALHNDGNGDGSCDTCGYQMNG